MGSPPYPTVLRLIALAGERWAEIDGELAARGIDAFGLRIDRFLNLIYAWYVARVEDRERFEMMLTAPLPGARRRRAPRTRTPVPTETAEDRQEAEGFLGFLAEHQQIMASTTQRGA